VILGIAEIFRDLIFISRSNDPRSMPSNAARSATVENFRCVAEEDPRIVAAFLGGSLASGLADQYSDIDMYYVIDPSEYESFHSSVKSLIDGLGPVAYFDEHNNFGFDLVLFMLTDGTKGELALGTSDKLKVMHAGPFKVLVDKKDILKNAQFPYEKMLEGEALRKDTEKQLRWYWYWYGIVLTAAARDHLWSAQSALNTVRSHLFNLLKCSYNLRPGAKVDRSLPRPLLLELGNTLPTLDPESLKTAAASMAMILKRETKGLLKATGAKYPTLFEKTVLAKQVSSSGP